MKQPKINNEFPFSNGAILTLIFVGIVVVLFGLWASGYGG